MSDIVTRLRNWREVHLARLHILMEQAADEVAILRSKLSLRDNLEQGLMDGVARLQDEVRRLGGIIAASHATLTDDERAAIEAAAKIIDAYDEEMDGFSSGAAATLRGLLDRLGGTPASLSTPSEGIEQDRCTLTDEEREAIESAIWDYEQTDDDEDCARMVSTLESLLERMA